MRLLCVHEDIFMFEEDFCEGLTIEKKVLKLKWHVELDILITLSDDL